MRRSLSVLVWILIGALASGASLGYFLYRANQDRQRLALEIMHVRDQADQANALSDKIAEQANQKLADASAQVGEAQRLLQRFETERRLVQQATTLPKPSSYMQKFWKEYFSIPLGISIHAPPGNTAEYTDRSITLLNRSATTTEASPWLSIAPYDANEEQHLSQAMSDPQNLTYFLDGRLLIGAKGKVANQDGNLYVLRLQSSASSTHLIWAHSNDRVSDDKVVETLSTLAFGN